MTINKIMKLYKIGQYSVFLIINILFSNCQSLNGIYSTGVTYEPSTLKFINKDEVLLSYSNDYNEFHLNYGKWKILDDTLIINFIPIPDIYKIQPENDYQIKHFKSTISDSIEFLITILNEDSKAYKCDVYVKNKRLIFGANISMMKETKIKIHKKEIPFTLYSSYFNDEIKIEIEEMGKYVIICNLDSRKPKLRNDGLANSTLKYFIDEKANEITIPNLKHQSVYKKLNTKWK